MKTQWTDNQLAEGKIRLAMRRVAGKYPFHVRIIEQFRLLPSASVPTMGVTVAGEHVALLYSANFVNKLPLSQLTGVLLHEIHHVLFGHILADPADYSDTWAWTVAMEVTVNEFVTEPLPKGLILRRHYPQLPPMESTDQRYARLQEATDRPPLEVPGSSSPYGAPANSGADSPESGAGGDKSDGKTQVPDAGAEGEPAAGAGGDKHGMGKQEVAGEAEGLPGPTAGRGKSGGKTPAPEAGAAGLPSSDAGGDESGVEKQTPTGEAGGLPGPMAGQGKSGAKAQPTGAGKGGPGPRKGKVLDDHSVWPKNDTEREAAEAAVKTAIEDAVMAGDPGDISEDLRRELTKRFGNLPGEATDQLAAKQGHLVWSSLLRRYIGRMLQVQPDFRRPPRRFPDMVGVLPGRRRRPGGRPRIMAVIDTSGSLTVELLEQISGELKRLAMDYQVLVVECDADIHRVYPYKPIRDIVGGGGTDFCPPLATEFLRHHRPDLVVYFTDGFGPAPEDAPRVPLVWCLTPEGETPATYGHVIRMSGAPDTK